MGNKQFNNSDTKTINIIFFKNSDMNYFGKPITSEKNIRIFDMCKMTTMFITNEIHVLTVLTYINEHFNVVNVFIYDCNIEETSIQLIQELNINLLCLANEDVNSKYLPKLRRWPLNLITCNFIHSDKQTIKEKQFINNFSVNNI